MKTYNKQCRGIQYEGAYYDICHDIILTYENTYEHDFEYI